MSISGCFRRSRSQRDPTARSRAARTSRSPASMPTRRAPCASSISGSVSNRLLPQNDPEARAQIGLLVVERALRLDDDEPRSGLDLIDDGSQLGLAGLGLD